MTNQNSRLTRRSALAAGAGLLAAPAFAQDKCPLGPPPHEKGPLVFLDYDQIELDAAYDQNAYQPDVARVNDRMSFLSYETQGRLGDPIRAAYGPDTVEGMNIWPTDRPGAPIFVFIHGGVWQYSSAAEFGFPAEMFRNAGVHYVAIDFADVRNVEGDLGVLADQVRRAIAWVHANAASFGGDPDRLYIGGHSSGGHLCAVALTTDWTAYGLPADAVKGGLCMSGLYDMAPVRLSWRRTFLAFTDAMEAAMSPQRHIARIAAPVTVSYGSLETPEFQRQARDFVKALRAAGKPVELIVGESFFHQDLAESLGNPYGPNGRAALALMGLAPA